MSVCELRDRRFRPQGSEADFRDGINTIISSREDDEVQEAFKNKVLPGIRSGNVKVDNFHIRIEYGDHKGRCISLLEHFGTRALHSPTSATVITAIINADADLRRPSMDVSLHPKMINSTNMLRHLNAVHKEMVARGKAAPEHLDPLFEALAAHPSANPMQVAHVAESPASDGVRAAVVKGQAKNAGRFAAAGGGHSAASTPVGGGAQ